MFDCDVRACLNALQFIKSKEDKLTLMSLSKYNLGRKDVARSRYQYNLGRKDVARSRYQVLEMLLYAPKRKESTLVNKDSKEVARLLRQPGSEASAPSAIQGQVLSQSERATNQRWGEIQKVVMDAGDFEAVYEGVHANFLRMGYADPTLDKTVQAAHLLSEGDLIQANIGRTQNFSLAGALPWPLLGVHRLCAATHRSLRQKLWLPKTFYQVRTRTIQNHNIVKSFLVADNEFARQACGVNTVVLEVLSHLVAIISPPLRAVQPSLMSKEEKSQLVQVVDTMLSLKLTYQATKESAGYGQSHVVYALDPPIHELGDFDKGLNEGMYGGAAGPADFRKNSKSDMTRSRYFHKGFKGAAFAQEKDKRKDLPNVVKQTLAHEVEWEYARRLERRAARTEQKGNGSAQQPDRAGEASHAAETDVTANNSRRPRNACYNCGDRNHGASKCPKPLQTAEQRAEEKKRKEEGAVRHKVALQRALHRGGEKKQKTEASGGISPGPAEPRASPAVSAVSAVAGPAVPPPFASPAAPRDKLAVVSPESSTPSPPSANPKRSLANTLTPSPAPKKKLKSLLHTPSPTAPSQDRAAAGTGMPSPSPSPATKKIKAGATFLSLHSEQIRQQKRAKASAATQEMHFKFNEGFTNAVRLLIVRFPLIKFLRDGGWTRLIGWLSLELSSEAFYRRKDVTQARRPGHWPAGLS
eukprot:g31367.t1